MAIQHDKGDRVQAQNEIPSDNNQQRNYNAPQNNGGVNWMNAARLFNIGGIGRNRTSETLMKLAEALKEGFKTNLGSKLNAELETIPLDRDSNPQLSLSVLVVCMREIGVSKPLVSYFALLIEGSVDGLTSRQFNFDNKQYEVLTTAGDTYTTQTMDYIARVVRDKYPEADCQAADCMTIPRAYDVKDENLVWATLFEVVSACSNNFRQIDNDLSIGEMDASSMNLSARFLFNQPATMDSVGLPVRSDIEAVLQTKQVSKSDAIQNEVKIARASAFFDLIWNPKQQDQMMYGGMPGQAPMMQPGAFQRYTPMMTITGLEPQYQTPSMLLMALASIVGITQGGKYLQNFLPNNALGKNKLDVKDFGAINYDVNWEGNPNDFGKDPLPTKGDNVDNMKLFAMMKTFFRDECAIAIDVSDAGASTWKLGAFAAIASNGANSRGANEYLLHAADVLTSGHFGRIYKGDQPICSHFTRVHQGYFEMDNQLHDLREVDYLWIANHFGKTDPVLIRRWSNTFNDPNMPTEIRLDIRRKILESTLGRVVFTGYADRYILDPLFLSALMDSCAAAGLRIDSQTPMSDMQTQRYAGPGALNTYAMNPNQQSNLFVAGSMGNRGHYGNVGNYNRWTR